MTPLRVGVLAIGVWADGLEGWPAMRTALLAPHSVPPAPDAEGPRRAARRPVPMALPAAERRRVPDGVAVALEVARETLLASAFDTTTMASVFASAHGDLAIVDYLCATLASDPTLISPTRFHHSVHNAAAGYWSIATPSVGPSTALAAGEESFALGLLEAATQAIAESRPVLLVVFDTPAVGLLARAAPNTALFGAALLLAPLADESTAGNEAKAQLSISIEARTSNAPLPKQRAFHRLAASSPAARAVALLEALARGLDATVDHPMDAAATLSVDVRPGRPRPACDAVQAIE